MFKCKIYDCQFGMFLPQYLITKKNDFVIKCYINNYTRPAKIDKASVYT